MDAVPYDLVHARWVIEGEILCKLSAGMAFKNSSTHLYLEVFLPDNHLKIALNHALVIVEALLLSDFMNCCDFYVHPLFFTNPQSQKSLQLISIAIEVIVTMTNFLASADRSSESGCHFCLLLFSVISSELE